MRRISPSHRLSYQSPSLKYSDHTKGVAAGIHLLHCLYSPIGTAGSQSKGRISQGVICTPQNNGRGEISGEQLTTIYAADDRGGQCLLTLHFGYP